MYLTTCLQLQLNFKQLLLLSFTALLLLLLLVCLVRAQPEVAALEVWEEGQCKHWGEVSGLSFEYFSCIFRMALYVLHKLICG